MEFSAQDVTMAANMEYFKEGLDKFKAVGCSLFVYLYPRTGTQSSLQYIYLKAQIKKNS